MDYIVSMKYQILIILSILLNCYNPFFPDTGTIPDSALKEEIISMLDSPEKTIQKLEQVYETKDIKYFSDSLIYDGQSFGFYIQNNFTEYNKPINFTDIVEISGNSVIPNGSYLYGSYTKEIKSHRNLFSPENVISFSQPLSVDMIYYDVSDSSNDTLDAYVWTDANKLTITSEKLVEYFGERTVEFPIGVQIFHLKKDITDSQWKIYRWYELN